MTGSVSHTVDDLHSPGEKVSVDGIAVIRFVIDGRAGGGDVGDGGGGGSVGEGGGGDGDGGGGEGEGGGGEGGGGDGEGGSDGDL